LISIIIFGLGQFGEPCKPLSEKRS